MDLPFWVVVPGNLEEPRVPSPTSYNPGFSAFLLTVMSLPPASISPDIYLYIFLESKREWN